LSFLYFFTYTFVAVGALCYTIVMMHVACLHSLTEKQWLWCNSRHIWFIAFAVLFLVVYVFW